MQSGSALAEMMARSPTDYSEFPNSRKPLSTLSTDNVVIVARSLNQQWRLIPMKNETQFTVASHMAKTYSLSIVHKNKVASSICEFASTKTR